MTALCLLLLQEPEARGLDPSPAIVQIGDCSGVCVDPAGLVLTAKHCDLPPVALVKFRDRTVLARRVYVAVDVEGPVVFDCDGDGFPCVPIADAVPPKGAKVWSYGYPSVSGQRPLRWASGPLLGGGTFTFRGGTFRGNVCGFSTGAGWSGGPLLNASGEVCGLLNSCERTTSVFVSFAAVRQACQIAKSNLSSKPTLYVFGSTSCGPCRAFKRDYADHADLKRQLTAQFEVVFIDIDQHREAARQFGITEIPAFVVTGKPTVTGYERAELLLAKLEVDHEPIVTPTPATTPAAEDPQPAADPAAPAAPVTAAPDNSPAAASTDAAPGTDDRLQTVQQRLDTALGAVSTALTVAQWLGIAGATGGVGGLVLGGIALARSFGRHRHETGTARDPPAAAPPPTVVTIDAPPPPQAIVPETKFAPYERDTFAQAFAWAEGELVRKYPGAVGTLETLRSLIHQYLAAQGLKPTP